MKTLTKIFITLLSFFFLTNAFAQKPFYLNKEGVIANYVNKDAKGKVSGYSQTTVTKIEGDDTNFTVTCETQVMDAKKKPLLQKPMEIKVSIENGTVKLDPVSSAGSLIEGMIVNGDYQLLPANLSVGDAMDDFSIQIEIGPIKTSSTFSNIKATSAETLDISGTAIECLIVESVTSSKVIGIKSEMKQKIWYGRNIGAVKTETYDKKGKLFTSQELISIEGL